MKVLILTASKHGSTEEIGTRIGSVIGERGHQVDVRCPTDVDTLEPYDVVVLGSAVYAGHWRKEARDVAERQHELLTHRPVWLFSSGPVGDPPVPAAAAPDGDEIRTEIGALDHRVFAGRIDRRELSIPERAVVRALHVAEGDYRDWDEVDRWAQGIAASISSG
jgi:menaquinone-dependent protoporphyrinogen oxidase